jgi:hypothetical protein
MHNGDLLIAHQNQIWRIPKGGGTALKFANPNSFSWWLRLSPDQSSLRFTRNEQDTSGSDEWEVSADGTNLHRMLPGWRQGEIKLRGNWTPDGKFFVFTMLTNNRADLWAVREKGDWLHKIDRTPVQLTSGPLNFEASQPSLDGKKIFAVGSQYKSELTRYDERTGQFPHTSTEFRWWA